MKKILAFVIVLIASVPVVKAQDQPEISGGLKGGLNYANIGGDASGVQSKISFHAGAFIEFMVTEKIGIQPEVVYSRQGAQASQNSSVKINYDYLNIPLLANFYATKKIFFQAGPQLGVLLKGEITDGTHSEDVKNQLNSTDFALAIGAGVSLSHTTIGLRYNFGISSTAKDSGDGSFPNQVLQVTVGFKIH